MSLDNQTDNESQKPAQNAPKTQTDLQAVIDCRPDLPEYIRQAIMALVETHKTIDGEG